jgi:acyl-[acyl-carrier-protein]-phospholipid O-acyltransferase / long-chain-fatty-acid--[acyl-carrier-protein] ligase
LPLIAGAKAWLYPNPLHYQLVPDLAYRADATILFATDTFLNGYARFADSYDYYRLRFAVAGAEKLKAETRHLWADKFGVAIYEGYGVTETAPVLAVNTPMANKPGTVGRMMPGMECKIVPVPGIAEGGELHVKGPNVMKGYIFHAQPDTLVPPADGWHATGDIVAVDEEGYLRILGRAKRFAKIAGEMISLPAVEEAISVLWKDAAHAVVSVNDPKRGEQLVLVTTQPNADRDPLVRHFHQSGMPEISLPKTIIILPELPLLGSGKTDYVTITAQAQAHLNKQKAA